MPTAPASQRRRRPGVPWGRDARPSLDEVLELRADRMATMRQDGACGARDSEHRQVALGMEAMLLALGQVGQD